MAVNLEDVVKLAEELTDDKKAELVVWLLDRIRTRELTVNERLAVFDSMTVDLGAVLPAYSDRRQDWYDDAR
ncbi:MAG: hypothetical protein SGI73_08205 [Chloroflexota bacterium]|nr:hypothetical protein [Chloroflexota bacterium]